MCLFDDAPASGSAIVSKTHSPCSQSCDFWEKILRYYDTKAVRSNRKVGRHYQADRKYTVGLLNPTYKKLKRFFAGAQNDKNTFLVPYCLSNLVSLKKAAFTLAEVLITLGIIGVVAAMTIPTISHNIQQAVLKNQFKKFYSTFWQAVIGIQTKEGRPIQCYYWANGYPGDCKAVCAERNEYGSCLKWRCENGDKYPDNYNGPMSECHSFTEELFSNTLKTTKICKDKAYEQGCLPEDFRGADIVRSEQNPDKEQDPNGIFSDSKIKNNYPVFVLADGSYVIAYGKYPVGMFVFVADINGQKGPNKWGYDLFAFQIEGDLKNGITRLDEQHYATETGGKRFQQMYNEAFNINAQ